MTYEGLAGKLAEVGVQAEPHVLRNKMSRGGFSAILLVHYFARKM